MAQGKKKIAMTVRDKQQPCRQLPALPILPIHASVPRMTPVRRVQLFRLNALVGHIALLGQGLLSCVLP
jgi:hypothetical protein